MRRFTILGLMGLVLGTAVAIAALRNADDYWATGMILATPLLFGFALIGALCGVERFRARRLGFAILGGGYFALAFLGLAEPNLNRLPTTKLLAYVHQQVASPQTFTLTVTTSPPASGQTSFIVSNSSSGPFNFVTTTAFVPGSASSGVTPGRWKSLLPGAANYEAFSIVGHCLFALMAGLLGAAIAVGFLRGVSSEKRRSATSRSSDPCSSSEPA
jgi:hypothetical protein